MLALLFYAGSAHALAVEEVIPQKQAAHFCRLLIHDEKGIYPLGYHAHRLITETDSLTAEQMFTAFVFHQDNWQTMRLFPHQSPDGRISWYAPADQLPDAMGSEHQKYIREVMPRLNKEIQAGNWETVDAYIDKMIAYQCEFGNNGKTKATISPYLMTVGTLSLLVLVVLITNLRRKTQISR